MRLGGPVFEKYASPQEWVLVVKKLRYGAAYCPVDEKADDATVAAYAAAAKGAGIVIAEVGAWSNPLAGDPAHRAEAIKLCQTRLALAERIGAHCCVNIAGSRGPKWDGPDLRDLSAETFDLIVQTVRTIIDAVKPRRTFYTLEPMPWVWPDSPDAYLDIMRAIDRPGFGVHLDPVNMVNCPRRYADTGAFLRECFAKLGPYIKSIHAKDTIIGNDLTIHLSETRPGTGALDYRTFIREADKLDPDMSFMLEHMSDPRDFDLAANFVRQTAEEIGVTLRA
jgi:sugar phosphate isomerase/epimerase